MIKESACLEKLNWQDVRISVADLNPSLANSIDLVDPGCEYTIYRYTCPFGTEILKDGFLSLINSHGQFTYIYSNEMDREIQADLNYNLDSNPVTFVLKNSLEAYILHNKNTVPLYGLVPPGKLFGTWQILNPNNFHTPIGSWNMTSGARSIFLLSKISDNISFNRLKRTLNLASDKPKALHDHWHLFKEIADASSQENQWSSQVLFFSKKWFEKLDETKWLPFKAYLLENAWKSSEFVRNEFMWDLIYSQIQNDRSLRPEPYIADTVRHILAMSVGALPGFAPALTDEAGPINKLKCIFRDVYKLEYEPIIMQPYFLDKTINRTIYYSLDYPTTMRCSPKARNNVSKLDELFSVQSLLIKYLNDIAENKYNVLNTPFYEMSKSIEYSFYHSDAKNIGKILSTKALQNKDPAFKEIKNFPLSSTFLTGCIGFNFRK